MLTTKLEGDTKLARQLKALTMPRSQRRVFHRKVGREVIKRSKQRLRKQKNVDGSKFKRRKPGSHRKGKILKNIMRSASGKELVKVFAGPESGKVTWPNHLIGKVAAQHQSGFREKYSAAKSARRYGRPNYSQSATPSQAKSLIAAGFRLVRGKYRSGQKKGETKTRRVSQRWIQENMSFGQAGLVLKILEGDTSKSNWEIETPGREFFGLHRNEVGEIAELLIDQITNSAKSKR